jgi:hypothetical protein
MRRGRAITVVLVALVAAALAAIGTPVASAYQARGKVLVIASHENANAGLDSAAALRSLGFKATLTLAPSAPSWQLPNLKAYSSVWSMIGSRGYTGEQLAQVEEYVSRGGRLYLGGVPITPETNVNVDQEVARDVLSNSQVRVIAGDWPEETAFNEAALDGISREPNDLTEMPQATPGEIGGIGIRNVLTHVGKDFSSAAFDEADMVSGKGRLVIYTDEWANDELPPSLRNAFVENVQDFLEGTPTRVSRTSAQYVALGDDFASGVGSFEYLPETTGPGGCYRAANGYAERVASDDDMSLAFDACRGATIGSLLGRKGGKEAQLDDVGPSTKAITLSTGWNDLGYGSVIKKCLSTREQRNLSEECRIAQNAGVEEARGWLDNGREPGVYELPGGKKSTNRQYLPSLAELYETILYQAPEAELVVIGYPKLFDSGVDGRFGPCQVGATAKPKPLYIRADNAAWMNDQTIALDSQIKRAVELVQSRTGRAIRYADASRPFTGHSLCDVDTPWINQRLLEGTKPVVESFQPTIAGQETLRELVESTATGF